MTLRPGIPADAEAIGNIRVAAWRAAYQKFMPESFLSSLDPSVNLDPLLERLARESNDFKSTVATADDLVVGFSLMGLPRYAVSKGRLELWALNVLPAYWRKGIGRSLTSHAIHEASSNGFSALELWCIQGNSAAQAAYQACGFTPTGDERITSSLTGHPLHEVHYAVAF